jgi:hypothetical protein
MKSCVVVFGREPLPRRVKTRLAAGIGSAAAARVYAVLLEHALDAASASGLSVLLSLAECPSAKWAAELSVPFEIQKVGGLGERMADAFARRFAEGEERVVVVGSDCAALTPDLIRQAAGSLDANDAVLGPAVDGGYYLIGQRAPGADLFTGIPFSDPHTTNATRERLAAHAMCWSELAELPDIDNAEDLEALLDDPRAPGPFIQRLVAAVHEMR